MADMTKAREGLDALRGLLNRERVEEIREGAGMRAVFAAAEKALAAYEVAKAALEFAVAVPLSQAAEKAVGVAWAHYRQLEAEWSFDQVAKLSSSLAALENPVRHPSYPIRRFFYAGLRQAAQAGRDKIAFIKTWKQGTDASDVLRQHVQDAWEGVNGAWDAYQRLERQGGLPGSYLFRDSVVGRINNGRKAKDRLDWAAVIKLDAASLETALPDEKARAIVAAQIALARKLDAGKVTVEKLHAAFTVTIAGTSIGAQTQALGTLKEGEKLSVEVTEADLATVAAKLVIGGNGFSIEEKSSIVARLYAYSVPKEARPRPPKAEAEPPADKVVLVPGGVVIGDAIGLDDPRFRGWVIQSAEPFNIGPEEALKLALANPAKALQAYADHLNATTAGKNGKAKAEKTAKPKKEKKLQPEGKHPKPSGRKHEREVVEG